MNSHLAPLATIALSVSIPPPQSCSKIKYNCIPNYTSMLETIEGIYENGQIQIDRLPQNIGDRSQVLVTFLDPNNIDPAKLSELIDSLMERLRQRIESIAGISQGFEELNQGQTRPIGDFIEDMQRKYDIPG
jgi:hypothetical protein